MQNYDITILLVIAKYSIEKERTQQLVISSETRNPLYSLYFPRLRDSSSFANESEWQKLLWKFNTKKRYKTSKQTMKN